MVVSKTGTPVSAKKKSVEEMKKLSEKKKIMMEEESEEEEEDTSDEGEEESEIDADEMDSEEGSEEDGDDDDDDDDDDDGEEEEDDDDDESEEDIAATSKKQKKGQTPEKSANKTPNKQPLQASFQKKEVQSNKKTPNKKKGLADNDSSMITPFKKTAKADSSSAKTPSSKQQKDTIPFKGTTEKRKREGGDEEGALKKPRADVPDTFVYSEQQKQRDRRCLFVRQFPKDTTEEELKALSPDIIAARFPGRRKGKGKFAFLEFASEKKAEENYPIIEKAKIRGEKLYVDFVGEKSKNLQLHDKQPRLENKKKIFVSGLPSTATMEDVANHFPRAVAIFLKKSGTNRIAYVDFETENAGEEALRRNSSLAIKGQPVTVMYAFINAKKKLLKKKRAKEVGQQKIVAKLNQKKKKKEEEDDDNEEDDDEDEDEDESDEDESDEDESDEE